VPRSDALDHACKVHKFLAKNSEFRAAAVISTPVVKDVCQRHITSPAASIFVGRQITGAILMASQRKEGYRVGLEFQGNGPLKRVFAECSYEGDVRAYIQNPNVVVHREGEDSGEDSELKRAIGEGLLNIDIISIDQTKPYRGTVPIQTGEVGDDIAFYLHQSEQIPSIVSLGVLLDIHGQVMCAGGIMIELMPGYSEATVLELEERALKAPSLVQHIMQGASPKDLVMSYLSNFELLELEHPHYARHRCRCTFERIIDSIRLFSEDEIRSMIASPESCKVLCEFCKREFVVSVPDLESLLTKN